MSKMRNFRDWGCALAFLVILSGCGKEEEKAQGPVGTPPDPSTRKDFVVDAPAQPVVEGQPPQTLTTTPIREVAQVGPKDGMGAAVRGQEYITVDWNQWRGPNRDGISPEKGWTKTFPASGPKILWRGHLGIGFSSLAISGHRVISMGFEDGKDVVKCLHADTGVELWRYSYPASLDPNLYEGGPNSTPAIVNGRVYAMGKDGQAICLDLEDGSLKWGKSLRQMTRAKRPDWGFSGSPLVEGTLVFYNVGTAGTALLADSGDLAWNNGSAEPGYASPIAFTHEGRRLIMIFGARHLLATVAVSGKGAWSYPWKTNFDINAADPILDGNRVFIASGYGHGCALLDFSEGKPRRVWENKELRMHFNPAVLLGGMLFGFDGNTNSRCTFKCVDLENGNVRWEEEGSGFGSVIASDGHLLVLNERGELLIAPARASGFSPTARARILDGKCWTAPAFSGGRLYARTANGETVCVDLSPGS